MEDETNPQVDDTVTIEDRPYKDARGRFLRPPPGAAPPITTATAHEMLRLREEKRQKLYRTGAQRAVLDPKLKREFGEDAHMVERAMTLQHIATTPDAGKAAVLADIQLQKAQGYDVRAEDIGTPPTDPATALAAGAAVAVLKFLTDVAERQRQRADVIEAESKDTE